MGFQQNVKKVALTPQHLIVEEMFTEDSIFAMKAPSLKIKGFSVLRSSHNQLMRRVLTIAQVEDVYFKGKKLDGMPGGLELLQEWLLPGQQLTTKKTGEVTLDMTYVGKNNIFKGTALGATSRSISLGFIDYIGTDPAKNHILYGNSAVPFIKFGEANALAAAYYNSKTGAFEVLRQFNPETLTDDFLRRFAPQYAVVG
ncbi:hypothetical protein [Labrys neptuniae]